MGRREIRSLKTRVGRECSISRRKVRLYNGGIRVGRVQGESHSVTNENTAWGAASRVRAVQSSKFGEGKL